MRYCVTGDALVRLPLGQTARIGDIATAKPNTDVAVDFKVLDRHGNPVSADRLFHSGEHQTFTVTTTEGFTVTGTANHPLLCLVDLGGVPTLLWKLIEEIGVGDHVVLQRTKPAELGCADWYDTLTGLLLGAFISEGFVSDRRAGFNNLDRDYFDNVVAAYDAVVGGTRYVSERTIASGSRLLELDVHNLSALADSPLAELSGVRSADKFIPDRVWNSPAPVKRAFLQALFEGDGSCSALPRNTIQISYSTRSARLAADVQQMLLEFGVLARRYEHATGEHKVAITSREQAELFATEIGFGGAKQTKLVGILHGLPDTAAGRDSDYVPGLAPFIRQHGGGRWLDKEWLRKNNVDRVSRWWR